MAVRRVQVVDRIKAGFSCRFDSFLVFFASRDGNFNWVDGVCFVLLAAYYEDFETSLKMSKEWFKKINNYMGKYWKNAEITNGRLAMIGFLALIINYGLFGWIIPGFI